MPAADSTVTSRTVGESPKVTGDTVSFAPITSKYTVNSPVPSATSRPVPAGSSHESN